MQVREVEIAIIGAGTAGLSAFEILPHDPKRIVLIDRGPLGGTCSRVGCMPSKALIHIAEDMRSLEKLRSKKHWKGDGSTDTSRVMQSVRELRDHFTSFTLKSIEKAGDCFVQGEARFTGPNTLRVGEDLEIRAERIIIATGSSPVVPKEWREFEDRVVTTDDFFELETLDGHWGVVGLGAIGLEMASALAGLGLKVQAFDKAKVIGGLKDPEVQEAAAHIYAEDFGVHLGEELSVQAQSHGEGLRLQFGSESFEVDRLLAALGRAPNIGSLDLAKSGAELDDEGRPQVDPQTMMIKGTPHFLAGDVEPDRAILHEAADEGSIAAHNAQLDPKKPDRFERRVPLKIAFALPQLAAVGQSFPDLGEAVIGQVNFGKQGRATLMGENRGLLRLYAAKKGGQLLGAEMIGPQMEHLAQFLALAIDRRATIEDMMHLPFYHPVLEEGLRTALRSAGKQCKQNPEERWQELRHV